tara:strand:+ start:2335 stop:2685 length:351 start_codon:yes stop_codon:yes gene_type:complete
MTEAEFESAVVDLAHLYGWRAVGHRTMRTKHGFATGWKYDGTGWPDLTLTHERGFVIMAELKVPPNKLSTEQVVWADHLTALADASSGIHYAEWRPADGDEIAMYLTFGKVTKWTL